MIYTNIATRYDELVSPYTSSFLTGPNVTNIFLQAHCNLDFSDHLAIISSPITGRYILNALDPAHTQPCRAYRWRPRSDGRHRPRTSSPNRRDDLEVLRRHRECTRCRSVPTLRKRQQIVLECVLSFRLEQANARFVGP